MESFECLAKSQKPKNAWSMKGMSNKTRLQTDKLAFWRVTRFRVTDRVRNDGTGTQLGVKYVNETVKEQREWWYAHVGHKVKFSHYRPGAAQRVGRGIALLFHDRGTRQGWMVSSTPRPHFTPGKDQVPILQEAGWAPGPVWTGEKSRSHRDSIPDWPVVSH